MCNTAAVQTADRAQTPKRPRSAQLFVDQVKRGTLRENWRGWGGGGFEQMNRSPRAVVIATVEPVRVRCGLEDGQDGNVVYNNLVNLCYHRYTSVE